MTGIPAYAFDRRTNAVDPHGETVEYRARDVFRRSYKNSPDNWKSAANVAGTFGTYEALSPQTRDAPRKRKAELPWMSSNKSQFERNVPSSLSAYQWFSTLKQQREKILCSSLEIMTAQHETKGAAVASYL